METFSEVLEWTQNVALVAMGAWAVREWRRRRSEQAGWLGATFGSLAFVVLVGLVTDAAPEDGAIASAMGKLSVVIIAIFPYLLLRFLGSFERVSRVLERGSLALAVGLSIWASFLPLDGPLGGQQAIVTVFVIVFVVYWFSVLSTVGWRFWRAGRGQPTLARRRLRILSVASLALGVTLTLLVAAAVDNEQNQSVTLVTHLMGLISAILFLFGFAPPSTLRTAWRQPEEQRLHEASLRLMGATSREEVGDILAPHMTAVVGARGVAIIDQDELVGYAGIGLPEARAAVVAEFEAHDDVMIVELANGRVVVWTSRYTPFFGSEEVTLLHRLGLLADLGMDRTSLLAAEREARVELERTNKELEAFVYTASHDLKSPLIAMLGYLEVLESDFQDRLGEEGDWFLERMVTNGRYMEALIGDLLELSRVGRMQTDPDDVDLQAMVDGLCAELGPRYPNVTYVAHELPWLWTNPTRVRQLFGNLMENAAKYGGDGITVEVSANRLTDGGIELRVHDDGVGIPEAYAEKVFGVFERLDPDDTKSGTGIGLAICRKIVESAGGHIWLADSERGADFRIRLPADSVRDDAPSDPNASQEVPA